jgi:hypothetical protein
MLMRIRDKRREREPLVLVAAVQRIYWTIWRWDPQQNNQKHKLTVLRANFEVHKERGEYIVCIPSIEDNVSVQFSSYLNNSFDFFFEWSEKMKKKRGNGIGYEGREMWDVAPVSDFVKHPNLSIVGGFGYSMSIVMKENTVFFCSTT